MSVVLHIVFTTFTMILFLFFKDFIYLFLERGEGKEKEREKNINVCLPPTGDLTCNPGICPDWESKRQPFGSQASTQSTDPHQPGWVSVFSVLKVCAGHFSISICIDMSHSFISFIKPMLCMLYNLHNDFDTHRNADCF